MNDQSLDVVRPFGRLMATEVAADVGVNEKGQYISRTSGSAWTDAPDTTDAGSLG
jgi:hypothetical protein